MGSRLGELQGLTKAATVARTRADTSWQNARMALAEAEAGQRLGFKRQIEQRHEHAVALAALRRAWRHLPHNWKRPARRAALVSEHQNSHQVDLRVTSLQHSLAREDWELDATVIDQHQRLSEPAAWPPERNRRAPLPEQPRHRSDGERARGLYGPAALYHQNLQQKYQGAG